MSTFRVRLKQGDTRTGTGTLDTVSHKSGTITNATNASPIVITSASHGLVTGHKITIKNVGGNTAANDNFTITVVDDDTFSLNGSTGNAAYTSGGTWVTNSVQRTIYVPGPNRKNRKLNDGEEFDDCNYWKRFASPQIEERFAFIEVVTDDGSDYVDGEDSTYPRVYNLTIPGGSGYSDDYTVDVLGDNNAAAEFTQITVTGDDVDVRLNGKTNAVISIAAGTTQTFNKGDLEVTKLEFKNDDSGAGTATVEVLVGLKSKCNS